MAEGQGEGLSEKGTTEDFGGEPTSTDPVPPRRRSWGAAPWLAALLILIIGGLASAPYWTPAVVPLLPWDAGQHAAAEADSTLTARVAALEQRPAPSAIDVDAVKSTQNALAHRIDQLNARFAEVEKRPAAAANDDAAVKSAIDGLTKRVDQLEAAIGDADRQVETAVSAQKAGLQQIEQRITMLEAQSASLKADDEAAVQNVKQELSRLSANGADLTNRLSSLEQDAKSQSAGQVRTDAMLALLLGEMREAVQQARPFQAEYEAFTTLAHDPAVAAAAKPLAEAAQKGLASRAVLTKSLAELSAQPAAAREPAAETGWGERTLARLRGLITIRRIDAAAHPGPETAVSVAQAALARGDLAGAVAALEPLTGAEADAVRPWLRMARERLAVEQALDHLQELLTVRLGNPPAAPAAAPVKAPVEPPDKPRAPS